MKISKLNPALYHQKIQTLQPQLAFHLQTWMVWSPGLMQVILMLMEFPIKFQMVIQLDYGPIRQVVIIMQQQGDHLLSHLSVWIIEMLCRSTVMIVFPLLKSRISEQYSGSYNEFQTIVLILFLVIKLLLIFIRKKTGSGMTLEVLLKGEQLD